MKKHSPSFGVMQVNPVQFSKAMV